MDSKNKIEKISLDISKYWVDNDYLTETNKNCGTLVAFDWVDDYLSEINTNIDLGDVEQTNFNYDLFVKFLKDNNFDFVLGLKNVVYGDYNPSEEWTDKLKENLESNDIGYDEYVVDHWPAPIPKFDVSDNIFILRYSFDEYTKVDTLAASQYLFEVFMKKSDWKSLYKYKDNVLRTRIISFCSEVDVFLLTEKFKKRCVG
jgi:hypothetical protein